MKQHFAIIVGALVLWNTQAFTQNLIQNPGFETGNFTGWNVAGSFASVKTGDINYTAHSGSSAAFFGPFNVTISQTIATTIGDSYTFDFWFSSLIADGSPISFSASWNGNVVFSLANQINPKPYTEESFTETATGDSTTLSFTAEGSNAHQWGLDDVSVVDVSPAGVPDGGPTIALLSLGMVVLAGFKRNR